MQRRKFLNSAIKLGAASYIASSHLGAMAQGKGPATTIAVGFSAGGSSDGVARLIADQLAQRTGRNFIIENRVGANGRLAADKVVQGGGDQNLFLVSPFSSILFASLTIPSWKIDIFNDLKPVANLTNYPLAIAVNPKIGLKNVRDLSAWLKNNPQKAVYGTSGLGGHNHLLGLALGQEIGVPLEVVAYKGNAPLVADMIGGHLPLAIGVAGDFVPFSKDIQILSVLTEKRYDLLPEIPTAKENGLNLSSGDAWYGMWASPKTPADQVKEISRLVAEILADQKVADQLKSKYFMTPGYLDDVQLDKRLRESKDYWQKIITETGFKPT